MTPLTPTTCGLPNLQKLEGRQAITLPDAPAMSSRQAEQFLLSMEILLKQAALGLIGFRSAIAAPCNRTEFEKAYQQHIVENGLQVWLSPGEAADLWSAVAAVNQ